MPDYRRLREEDPQQYPQLVQYPSDLPDVASSSNLALAIPDTRALDNMPSQGSPDDVSTDKSMFSSQYMPDRIYKTDDALKSPWEQISEGLGRVGGAVGEDLGSLGSAIGRGLNAITPSQDTLNSIGMRLQNMGAAYYGITPPYLQNAKILHDMGSADELMQMKRQAAAFEIQKQQEAQQQNYWNNVFKVMESPLTPPQQHAALTQMGKQGNPVAFDMANNVNAKMIADFNLVKDQLDMTPEQIVQGLKDKTLNYHDLSAMITTKKKDLEEQAKVTAQERAQAKQIDDLTTKLKTDPSSLTDSQIELLDKFNTNRQERALKIQKLQQDLASHQIDLNTKQLMPQVSSSIPQPGGKTGQYVVDPVTNQRSLVVGEKPPPISIENKIIQKTGESLSKPVGEIIKASQAKALDSVKTMESAGRIDKILETANVNLGPTANIRQYIDRLSQGLNMGGKTQAERIANTRLLIQGLAQFGLQARSLLEGGGSISNYEQELVERASSGNISDFTPNELRTFVRAIDTQARSIYKQHQDQLANVRSEKDETTKELAKYYQVPAAPKELPPLKQDNTKSLPKPYDDPALEAEYQKFKQDWKKSHGAK